MPALSTSESACQFLCRSWQRGEYIDDLPKSCRPRDRLEGYAIQALWPAEVGQPVAGWKIAATSAAGQKHIGVSGPVAGPVFAHRVYADGAPVSLVHNLMRVAECELVFRLGHALGPHPGAYGRQDVLAAVASVHPGIEVPDSRFLHFEEAGEAQLIADCACMNDMLVGDGVAADRRLGDLAGLRVQARVSDGRELSGMGANALGDPVEALVWLVNELTSVGRTLEAGHFITTGACVPPIPVSPGDVVSGDFGWVGRISARFV